MVCLSNALRSIILTFIELQTPLAIGPREVGAQARPLICHIPVALDRADTVQGILSACTVCLTSSVNPKTKTAIYAEALMG